MEGPTIFDRLKKSIEIVGFPEPEDASIELTRLYLACFVGQCITGQVIPVGMVDEVINWLNDTSANEIKALWN